MSQENTNVSCGGGCFGIIVAFILSYALNGSMGWAILHGLFTWFYVLYALIFRAKEILPALTRYFS